MQFRVVEVRGRKGCMFGVAQRSDEKQILDRAFHTVDDIAVDSAERANTQMDRQAGKEHTCTDGSLDIIACQTSS